MKGSAGRNIRENRYWYVAAVVVLAITVVLGYLVYSIEPVDRDLKVDKVFFKSVEYGDDETDLRILVFLTNDGDSEIEEVKVRAFAIERDSNLARSEDTVTIGKINGQTTEEGELSITVPNRDSYRIELLVFEDSKLTIRGSGTIDLRMVGVPDNISNGGGGGPSADPFSIDDGNERGMFDTDDGGAFLWTSICILIVPAVIVVIIVVAVYSSSKKNKSRKDLPEEDWRKAERTRSRAEPIEGLTRIEDFQPEEEKEEEQE